MGDFRISLTKFRAAFRAPSSDLANSTRLVARSERVLRSLDGARFSQI